MSVETRLCCFIFRLISPRLCCLISIPIGPLSVSPSLYQLAPCLFPRLYTNWPLVCFPVSRLIDPCLCCPVSTSIDPCLCCLVSTLIGLCLCCPVSTLIGPCLCCLVSTLIGPCLCCLVSTQIDPCLTDSSSCRAYTVDNQAVFLSTPELCDIPSWSPRASQAPQHLRSSRT